MAASLALVEFDVWGWRFRGTAYRKRQLSASELRLDGVL